jgi:tRNA-dihydrouridine synthase A
MMDCTDRHDRYLLRLISRHTRLYTEMITTAALRHGDTDRLLAYDPSEHPLAIQLGGSDPDELAECARMAAARGYDEVNLNVGCPSNRVQAGRFGVCLMLEPELVARCIAAMVEAITVPVTLKTRIGVDDRDSYQALADFVGLVSASGCRTFIIHARKAWLDGLSAKENRSVPPLRYDRVRRLKADFPALEIILNGGIRTLAEARAHLSVVDGVMIGREAYRNPYLLAFADAEIFGDGHPIPSRHEVIEQFLPYVERELARGARLNQLARHIVGMFHGEPGARAWRRYLSEHGHQPGAGVEVLQAALAKVPRCEGTRRAHSARGVVATMRGT